MFSTLFQNKGIKSLFIEAKPENVQLDGKQLSEQYDKLLELFPSMYSLLIVKDTQLVFERYMAPSRVDKSYSIKSITKSIMNALVGISIRDGLIASVDQPVSELLPHLSAKQLEHVKGVRVRHLLSMTHGIIVEENGAEMLDVWRSRDWTKAILDKPLFNTPGEQFLYCTCSTHLLSIILTEVTQMSLDKYASRELFRPLGFTDNIKWEQAPNGVKWGGNNMYLPPRVLARFGQLYLTDGVWNGQRILPAGWVEESLAKQSSGWDDYAAYGYLWWVGEVDGVQYAFASGYGGQYVYVVPSLSSVIVLTANSDATIAEMQSTTNPIIKDPSWVVKRFLLDSQIRDV